jgi:hypothetical protein
MSIFKKIYENFSILVFKMHISGDIRIFYFLELVLVEFDSVDLLSFMCSFVIELRLDVDLEVLAL